jgi:hypothetical protein
MKLPRRQPRCSFCSTTGHNRSSCAHLKQTKATIISQYILLRSKYWNLIKDLPFGLGALIRFVKDESCYNDQNLWITVTDQEVIQIVVGLELPTRISEKAHFVLDPIGRIGENNYSNSKAFPVVAGYITNHDISHKRYGYHYYYDLNDFQEKHLVSAGATLDETISRVKLEKWLNAEDIKNSYIFDIKGRGREAMFDSFEMSTRIFG